MQKSSVASLLFAFLLTACTQKTAEQQIADAEQLLSQGEVSAAIIELKSAVVSQPSNSEARFKLGTLEFMSGNFPQAEKELRRALELGYSADDIVPTLVKSIFYQNDFERLLVEVETLPSLTGEQNTSTVKLFSFLAEIKSSNYDALIPDGLKPEHLLIAQAYRSLADGKPEIALNVAKKFTTPTIEPFEKTILFGNIYSLTGDHVNAIIEFEKALKLYPDYHVARFQLTEQLIEDKQLSRADEQVEILLGLNPNSGHANYLKSLIYFYQDNYEKALQTANIALQNGARAPEASFIAGTSAYKTGRVESALRYLSTATNTLPYSHPSHRLLAQVKLELGYVQDVAESLPGLDLDNQMSSEIYGLAALQKLQIGNLAEANQYIEKANAVGPTNPVTLLRKGLIELENGSAEEAAGSLEQALSIDPKLDEGWMLLARSKYQSEGLEAALAVARQWMESNPINGQLLEGLVYLSANQEANASASFYKALELSPNHIGALRYAMIARARETKFDEALLLGNKLLDQTPDNLQNLIDVVNILIATDKESTIFDFLDERAKKAPESQAPITAKAFIYLRYSDPDNAIKTLKSIKEPTSFSYFQALGDAYMKKKDYPNAVATYRAWTQKLPNDNRGWYRLIAAYQFEKNPTSALSVIEEAKTFFPRDERLTLLQAYLSAFTGDFDQSRIALAKVQNEDAIVELTAIKGLLALNEKRYKEAVPLLKASYDTVPSFGAARLLALAFQGAGNPEQGYSYFAKELKTESSTAAERLVVAEYAVNNELYEQGISQFKAVLKEYPDNFITLNNYASALLMAGKYQDAKTIAEKAMELEPQSPYILDTYGVILIELGDVTTGRGFIEKALGKAPNNTEIQLHMVKALVASNDIERANTMIKKIKPKTPIEKRIYDELVNQLSAL